MVLFSLIVPKTILIITIIAAIATMMIIPDGLASAFLNQENDDHTIPEFQYADVLTTSDTPTEGDDDDDDDEDDDDDDDDDDDEDDDD